MGEGQHPRFNFEEDSYPNPSSSWRFSPYYMNFLFVVFKCSSLNEHGFLSTLLMPLSLKSIFIIRKSGAILSPISKLCILLIPEIALSFTEFCYNLTVLYPHVRCQNRSPGEDRASCRTRLTLTPSQRRMEYDWLRTVQLANPSAMKNEDRSKLRQ